MAKDAVHPSRRETSFGWMEVTVARGDEPIVERLGFERSGRAHQHDMWEHCRVVSGSGTIVVGDDRVSVQEGDTCQIPPHTDHWMEPDDWMEIVLMYTHPTN